ncbi:hypothetical protein OQA88_2583 [Cercophora sp. LCS_1]
MVLRGAGRWPTVIVRRLLGHGPLPPHAAFRLKILLSVAVAFCIEAAFHVRWYAVPRPLQDLDAPFSTQCQDPVATAAANPRENATFVMLARNNERHKALQAIQNIENQFNQWFHYPVLFLNDEPWDPEFVRALNASVSGEATFEVLKENEWSFPWWTNANEARERMKAQGEQGIYNGGKESYHHMCRFYSGTFYQLEALKKYKWYWRLEPGIEYTCAITYDPFFEMARHGKAYGFVIALWEVPETCPSLFRAVDEYRRKKSIEATSMWRAMVNPSWAPWPLRRLRGWFGGDHRDFGGDTWNLCHYWSNFEIADLDFFRGAAYQELFDHLDRAGGFYDERWGDAPVHSLAVHLLLPPEKLHHFSDIGYHHEPFFQCPGNAPGGQLTGSTVLPNGPNLSPESEGAIGCRCRCMDGRRRNNRPICLNTLQSPAVLAPI